MKMPLSQTANDTFHSKFGGMWVDRGDFLDELGKRVRTGRVPERLRPDILKFERDGVVVLEKTASEHDLVRCHAAISAAFRDGHSTLLGTLPGQDEARPVKGGSNPRGMRIVDCFAVLPEALDLLSSPRLVEFLRVIFDEQPKLFQSLSFEMGSEQGLHQDTAYVVVNRPMELVGCWIALEDVCAGSGELQYMVGSHRLPDFEFGGNRKYWTSSLDSADDHAAWSRWILDEGRRRGYPIESFFAKRGDILVWHADLAHGGAAITRPETSRRSLVGHFCPVSAVPDFVGTAPDRATTMAHRGIAYCSRHYDLTEAARPIRRERASSARALLALEGKEFIEAAYATVLNRAPDAEGLKNYLAELSMGVRKIDVVSRLRNSVEGRRLNLPLVGYRRSLIRSRLSTRRATPNVIATDDSRQL
jgi:phytanoyl-CoA hydroxylase